MSASSDKIVLYDGDCGFCNRTVAYVIKKDRTCKIKFAAIQSDFAKHYFQQRNWPKPDLSTFYYIVGKKRYEKSTAALKVAQSFNWINQLFQIGWIVPRFFRDLLYDLVARHRRKIARNYCFFPNEAQKSRFL